GLFALSPNLILISGDAKPYASDVAISLGLTLLGFEALRERLMPRALAILTLFGVAAVWFSTPAAFVFAGVSLAGLGESWILGSRSALTGILLSGLMVAASLLLVYLTVLRHYLARNQLILEEYSGGFLPVPPGSVSDLLWFPQTFVGLFDDAGLGLPAL